MLFNAVLGGSAVLTFLIGEGVKGALCAGTRIQKKNSETGDPHANGDKATVLCSFFLESDWNKLGYLVEFDDAKGTPVLIAPHRIEEAIE